MTGSDGVQACMEKRVSLASAQRFDSLEGVSASVSGWSKARGGCESGSQTRQGAGCWMWPFPRAVGARRTLTCARAGGWLWHRQSH